MTKYYLYRWQKSHRWSLAKFPPSNAAQVIEVTTGYADALAKRAELNRIPPAPKEQNKTLPATIGEEETAAAEQRMYLAMRDAISEFCDMHAISRTNFAQVYGVSLSYLSQILAGKRTANPARLALAFQAFGYGSGWDLYAGIWILRPIPHQVAPEKTAMPDTAPH